MANGEGRMASRERRVANGEWRTAGVTLLEVLVALALLGLIVGLGLALWPSRTVRVKAGLDGLEELWGLQRPGDCMEWDAPSRQAVFRRGGPTGAVYARWRLPAGADGRRLRSFCDGGGVLLDPATGRALGTVVCADPGPPRLPGWSVCRSPAGGVVFRTVVR